MPWKDQRVMSQKLQFIEKAERPGANISALCREFGISRQTGHKWLRRYRAAGLPGSRASRAGGRLEPADDRRGDRRRASSSCATATRPGGRTRSPGCSLGTLGDDAPSKSTVARVLQRLGKIRRRRPPVRVWSRRWTPARRGEGAQRPVDHRLQGLVARPQRRPCEPLTVRDAFSRKVLAVDAPRNDARRRMSGACSSELFEQHGLPAAMQSDNGTPFVCTRARGGLSRLSAWLVSLGIRLVRSRPEDTKTDEPRVVYLTERVLTSLSEQPRLLHAEFVFVNPATGRPWQDIQGAAERAREAAGLSGRLGPRPAALLRHPGAPQRPTGVGGGSLLRPPDRGGLQALQHRRGAGSQGCGRSC